MTTPPVVLTIAATDSGGGAGIAADLATFAALGVHGCCVVTAVTAQDTTRVHTIHPIPTDIVEAQLDAVLVDLDPAVIKTGMLATADTVKLVARRCAGRILVVDPVLQASTGAALADDEVIAAYLEHLLPVATVLTPNVAEHVALGAPQGPGIVVTTGPPDAGSAGQRVETVNDHGTGCTFASALAAQLALGTGQGEAVALAHSFVSRQLTISRDWTLGAGRGPVAHIHNLNCREQSNDRHLH
jgi:hydroxymethylpyrimidine/phosphomethylpyrimidine kinase